ncbi:MAG: alpha/beta fold hydrolase [Gemmatimonadetes bacterium]|nr:alpha/beta hydrolase [Gemmatimonadota bacterium]NIQ59919.1 alpha/beta hydrolase [Gemmatimonadota bacterium]NIU80115.1 alpha/beta fold hydrolase [Gammaproteobacteria bacterium]NIX48528.1 alpha/beta fold hydrolase [Gemmatimonadota bacterium]NIY12972.1 alpha/beta fold hydrolase [Gemmatimonadota bacterium]
MSFRASVHRARKRTARLLTFVATVGLAACGTPGDGGEERSGRPAVRDTAVLADGGRRLHVKIMGAGRDTVVVPLAYWNQAGFGTIAGGRTFIFYDPRGRRESDPVAEPSEYGLERDLADLEAVRVGLGLGRFALIGTSYYGALAARYAMLHPERVSRLVLVGALYPRRDPHIRYEPPADPGRVDSGAVARLERMREEGRDTLDPVAFCRAYWAVEGPSTVGDPASAARRTYPCELPNEWPTNTSAWGAGVFRSLGDWDWREAARRLEVPALVIHGEMDRMVPLASSAEWAELLPGGWLLVLPGAGHVPWWEHEETVFPRVDEFLDGQVPAAASNPTASRRPALRGEAASGGGRRRLDS